MTEMIDRVARASFAAWNKQRGKQFVYEDMSPEEREWSLVHARVVIEALRDPTESMLEAGSIDLGAGGELDDRNLSEVWKLMIDEALK